MRCLIPCAAAVLAIAGCSSCEETPGGRVPFKRDAGEARPTGDPGDPAPRPFEPIEGRTFPGGTDAAEHGGLTLEIADEQIHALLTLDADADGAKDAYALSADEDGDLRVRFGRGTGPRLEETAELAFVPMPDGCTLERARLRTLSPRLAVARLERRCEPGGAGVTLVFVSVERVPRHRETIELLEARPGRADGTVTAAVRAADQDEDGFADLLVDLSIAAGGEEAVELTLTFLDRPGGMARERGEPDETLTRLAGRAHQLLERDPAAAMSEARRALAVHAMLCSDAGRARVAFGDVAGASCGRSLPAGRAATVVAAALARQGRLFDALDAAAALDQPSLRVTAADRALVEQAWDAAPTPEGLTLRRVGTHTAPVGPAVRLSAVAFLADGRLLLRGQPALVLDPETGAMAPLPGNEGTHVMRDPSERLAIVDVVRTCEGYALAIVPAAMVVGGVVSEPPTSRPLIAPGEPFEGCPDAEPRSDDGGYRVLGWAPQGAVAARRDEVRLIPLTVTGDSAEPARDLGDAPAPAPLPGGASTPDGSAFVLPTRYGVVLRHLTPPRRSVLVRPRGWGEIRGEVTDAAIAPTQDRIAILVGEAVYLIEGL